MHPAKMIFTSNLPKIACAEEINSDSFTKISTKNYTLID